MMSLKNQVVLCSKIGKNHEKGRIIRNIYIVALLPLLLPVAYAGPEGGTVVGGNGTISQTDLTTTIQQNTSRMAIDWQSFNVAADERVQFIQPDAQSIVLNNILGNSGSLIQGQIDANGHVVLVNPNGVFFTETSTVNVGGLIGSGLHINSDDFMNGDLLFSAMENSEGKVVNQGVIAASLGGSVALLGKQVENSGLISAQLGAVSLAAGKEAVLSFDNNGILGVRVTQEILQDELGVDPAVLNSGNIEAASGRILLTGSTSRDVFSQAVNTGDMQQHTSVVMHDDGSFTLGAGAKVVNTGVLDVSVIGNTASDAGRVVVLGENVNHSGQIYADNFTEESLAAGAIEIHSLDTTTIEQNGSISASNKNGVGGDVFLLGDKVGLFDNAQVVATGSVQGGVILVGGDEQGFNNLITNANFIYLGEQSLLNASGVGSGDGGQLIAFANDTARIYGELAATSGEVAGNGGFIETSGKRGFEILNSPLISGVEGGGEWLIDPYNITIDGNGDSGTLTVGPDGDGNDVYTNNGGDATLNVNTLQTALAGDATVRVVTANNGNNDGGDIFLNAALSYDGTVNGTLILEAARDIQILAGITDDDPGSDRLNLKLFANTDNEVDSNGRGGDIFIAAAQNSDNAAIELNGGNFEAYADNIFVYDNIDTGGGDFIVGRPVTAGFATGDYNNNPTGYTQIATGGNFYLNIAHGYTGSFPTVFGSYDAINGSTDLYLENYIRTRDGDFKVEGDSYTQSPLAWVDITSQVDGANPDAGDADFLVDVSGDATLGWFIWGTSDSDTAASGVLGAANVYADGDITLQGGLAGDPLATGPFEDYFNISGTRESGLTLHAGGDININSTIYDRNTADNGDNSDEIFALNLFANSTDALINDIDPSSGDVNIGSGVEIFTSGGTVTASGVNFVSTGALINTDWQGSDSGTADNSTDGGHVGLTFSGTVNLGDIYTETASVTDGDLTVSAANGITSNGVLDINGITTLNASDADLSAGTPTATTYGAINISGASNNFNGEITIPFARSAVLADLGAIDFGVINIGDGTAYDGSTDPLDSVALSIASSGTINFNGDVSVTGDGALVNINTDTDTGAINLSDGFDIQVASPNSITQFTADSVSLTDSDFNILADNRFNELRINADTATIEAQGNIGLGASVLLDSINLETTGDIGQIGAITTGATNSSRFATSDGAITLDSDNNFNFVQLIDTGLNSVNDFTINNSADLRFASIDVAGDLTVSTTNIDAGLSQTGAIIVGGLADLSAVQSIINLDNDNNDFANVIFDDSDNSVTIHDINSLVLGAASPGDPAPVMNATNLTIVANANNTNPNPGFTVTQTQPLVVSGNASFQNAGGDIALNNIGNDFSNVVFSARDVDVYDANGINFGGGSTSISRDLTVTTVGNISDTSTISVAGVADFDAGTGSVILDADNDFADSVDFSSFDATDVTSNFVNASGSAVTVNDVNEIILGNISSTGNLTVTGSNIYQTTDAAGGIVVGIPGSVGLTASFSVLGGNPDLVLLNDNNAIYATFTPGGNYRDFSFANIAPISLGALTTTRNLSLQTIDDSADSTGGGDITQTGAWNIAGSTTLVAENGDITLANSGNVFGSDTGLADRSFSATASGNDITIVAANPTVNPLQLSGITANIFDLSVSSVDQLGGLNDALVLNSLILRDLDSAGSVILGNTSNNISGGNIQLLDINDQPLGLFDELNITNTASILLGELQVNSLSLNSTAGSINQTGIFTVNSGGEARFTARDSILLDQSNSFSGDVFITQTEPVDINNVANTVVIDSGALSIGGITTSDVSVEIIAGGSVTQNGVITAPGTTTINSGANLVTLGGDNSFNQLILNGTGTISVNDVNGIQLGSGGQLINNLTITANGDVGQFSALNVTTGDFSTSNGDILFDYNPNGDGSNSNNFGAISASANSVTLVDATEITLQTISIANSGVLDVTVYGAGDENVPGIGLGGALNLAGDAIFRVNPGSSIDLDSNGNNLGGSISFLTNTGSGLLGSIGIANTGDLVLGDTVSTPINLSSNLTARSQNGSVIATTALNVGGIATFIVEDGDPQNNDPNVEISNQNNSFGSVDIRNTNSDAVNTISTGNANVLNLVNANVAGDLILNSYRDANDSIVFTPTGNQSIVVDGNLSINQMANTNVSLISGLPTVGSWSFGTVVSGSTDKLNNVTLGSNLYAENIVLDSVDIAGDLNVETSANISDSNSILVVGGDAIFNAGTNAITLATQNHMLNALSLTGGSAIVNNNQSVELISANLTTLTLDVAGNVSQRDVSSGGNSMSVTGVTDIEAANNGQVDLSNLNNSLSGTLLLTTESPTSGFGSVRIGNNQTIIFDGFRLNTGGTVAFEVANGNIQQVSDSAPIIFGGVASFIAANGDIDIDNNAGNNFTNLNLVANNAYVNDVNGGITLGGATVGDGIVDIESVFQLDVTNGDINLNVPLLVGNSTANPFTGVVDFTVDDGRSIVLDNNNNEVYGEFDLKARGNNGTLGDLAIANISNINWKGGSIGGDLTLRSSAGNVYQDAADPNAAYIINGGMATFSAPNGYVDIANPNNQFQSVAINLNGGLGAQAARVLDGGGSLDIGNINITGTVPQGSGLTAGLDIEAQNNITLLGGSSIIVSDSTALSVLRAGEDSTINLLASSGIENNIAGTAQFVSADANPLNSVRFSNESSITLDTISLSSLELRSANGNILQSGAYATSVSADFTASNGDVILENDLNNFNVISIDAQSASIRDSNTGAFNNDLTLGAINLTASSAPAGQPSLLVQVDNGSLLQQNGTAITNIGDPAVIEAVTDLRVDNSFDITLSSLNNDFDILRLSDTGNNGSISVVDVNSVSLAQGTFNNVFTLNAGGDITQQDTLRFNNDVSFISTNNVLLDNNGNNFSAVAIDAASASLFDNDAILLMDINVTQNTGESLRVEANGNITQRDNTSVTVAAGSSSTFNATGASVNLAAVGNSNNFAIISGEAQGFNVADINNIVLGDITVSGGGTLEVNVGGGITDSGNLVANGDSNFYGGDAEVVALNGSGHQLSGQITIGSQTGTLQNVTLANNGATTLGDITANNNFTLDSTGVVTQVNGSLISVGNQASIAANDATSSRDITLAGDNQVDTLQVRDANNLRFNNASDLNVQDVSATGDVNISAPNLNVNGVIDAQNIALGGNGGVVAINSSLSTSGALNVSGEGINLSNNISAQNITLDSLSGQVTQSGEVIATDGDIVVAGGSYDFSGATLTANNGLVDINIENTINAGNIASTGVLLVANTGDITATGIINSSTNDIEISAGQHFAMNGSAQVISDAGNINISSAGNSTVSSLVAENGVISVDAGIAINTTGGADPHLVSPELRLNAVNGIGDGGNLLITQTTDLYTLNVGGDGSEVDIQNFGEVNIQQLHNQGAISFVNDRDINIAPNGIDAGILPGSYLQLTSGESIYGIGPVTATSSQNPDVKAYNATFNAFGDFGSYTRPLFLHVINLADGAVGNLYTPLYSPIPLQGTDNIRSEFTFGSFESIGTSGDQLVEVETLDEVDPAIFTDVRNYIYNDISIRLPRDQLYEDEFEDDEDEVAAF